MKSTDVTVKAYAQESISSDLFTFLTCKDESASEEELSRSTKRRKYTPKASWYTLPSEPEWANPLVLAHAAMFVDFPTQGVTSEMLGTLKTQSTSKTIQLRSKSNQWTKDENRFVRAGSWATNDIFWSHDRSAAIVLIQTPSLIGLSEIVVPCTYGDRIYSILKANALAQESFPSKSNLRFSASIEYNPCEMHETRFRIEIQVFCRDAKSLTEASFERLESVVLELLFPSPNLYSTEKWETRDFYENVHVPSRQGTMADEAATLDVAGLDCKLYPFQRRTVRWMLEREGVDMKSRKLDKAQLAARSKYGFISVHSVSGNPIYVNHWLGIATSNESLLDAEGSRCAGGLLAEEMGLGKTVEVLSLLLLNQRPMEQQTPEPPSHLIPCRGTIIISPLSIQQQWKSEIEMHAPGLRVMVYGGLANMKGDEDNLAAELIQYDVVLVSYNVLSREIHYATEGPTRALRHEKQYRKRKSPLVMIDWWRCILDECQMIENGISQAAKVANEIPRRNAWAVSGTPLKKDANDLYGLLTFLRIEPFFYSNTLWNRLVMQYKPILTSLLGEIALRHSKDSVKAELVLPPQTRLVITLPFTSIEEQHYSNLFQEMCDDCGLSLEGAPSSSRWTMDDHIEKMRMWLSRLRQTVLHPEVGERNRKALGSTEGPLRTVAQVLKVMTEQNEVTLRAEERTLLTSKLRRGQILEHAKRTQNALDIWKEVYDQATRIVLECRKDQPLYAGVEMQSEDAKQTNGDMDDDDIAARAGAWRLRLRSSLEVLHMATFFVANGYYQLKTNEEITKPESEEFKALEKLETEMYDDAKLIRKEILSEALTKANELMSSIKKRKIVELPECSGPSVRGGIESRHVVERAGDLCVALNRQAEKLREYRAAIVKSLLLPLIDQEESELQGDEYEISTKQQDEVYVYMEILRAVQADRHDALTGQDNFLIKREMETNLRNALVEEGHAPKLMIRLLRERDTLKPKPVLGSLRNCVSELRSLRSNLERRGGRFDAEIGIVESALKDLQHDFEVQTKTMAELERELDVFMSSSNSRLAFYRQLQTISDSVAPFEEEFDDAGLDRRLAEMRDAEQKCKAKITTLESRARYLGHLHRENGVQREAKTCIICQEAISVGVLTSCGHQFCKDCLRHWYNAHHTCPVCKAKLHRSNFHQISYKPAELSVQEEGHTQPSAAGASGSSSANASDSDTSSTPSIYSGISRQTFAEIANIDVPGASFGTKIDTLARHILYLRQTDPGSKSIVFSQFRDFLDILARAFRRFKISFVSVYDKPQQGSKERGADSGIERFKRDDSIECFFLHAKAQAAGLNLVNATHVFLCEPLVNTALELQAIARVHRIGQHRPTTVYMYLVDGTVEQAIYEIGVQRRLEHMGRVAKQGLSPANSPIKVKGRTDGQDDRNGLSTTQEQIDSAESLHLQENSVARLLAAGRGGGELVPNDDVWACLFRTHGAVQSASSSAAQRTVAGFLAADAAEQRMVDRRRQSPTRANG